jgi:hypothetical protein
MITPVSGCSLIIIGNCPYLVFCPVWLCCFLGVVLILCHGDFISQSCPSLSKVIAERMAQRQRGIQNEGKDAKLFSCF